MCYGCLVRVGGGDAASDAAARGAVLAEPAPSAEGRAPAEWFWTEVAALRARWCVLEHPLIARLAAGDLPASKVAACVAEQYHAAVALAAAWSWAASHATGPLRAALIPVAQERAADVRAWRRLLRAAGWGPRLRWWHAGSPLRATVDCAHAWAGDRRRGLTETLAVLYAIESGAARLAGVQRAALVEHYRFEERAVQCLRAGEGGAHVAADLRRVLEGLLARGADPFAALGAIEGAYRGLWCLVDEVTRAREVAVEGA